MKGEPEERSRDTVPASIILAYLWFA